MLNDFNLLEGFVYFLVFTIYFGSFFHCAKLFLNIKKPTYLREAITLISTGIIYSCIYSFSNIELKLFLNIFIFILSFKIVYNISIISIIYISIIELIILFIFDILFGITLNLVINAPNLDILDNLYVFLLLNLSSSCFIILISSLLVKKIKDFLNWLTINNDKIFILYILIIFSILTFLMYDNIYNSITLSDYLINILIIGLILIIFLTMLKERYLHSKINIKYTFTKEQNSTYKDLIEDYAKNQHENNNEWTVAYGLVQCNNEKAKNFITTISNGKKIKTDIPYLKCLDKLNDNGLIMLIFDKMNKLEQLKIRPSVSIEYLKEDTYIKNLNNEEMNFLYKLIGVFLDNAVEALNEVESPFFEFEVYVEDSTLYIIISNNYKNIVEGQSTKGSKRGYGLKLIRDMSVKFSNITYNTIVTNNIFSQEIKIIKKSE